jgi:hypothetical protein
MNPYADQTNVSAARRTPSAVAFDVSHVNMSIGET